MTMNILNENKKRNIIIAAAAPVLTIAVIAFAAYSITTILSSYVGSSSRPLQAAYAQEAAKRAAAVKIEYDEKRKSHNFLRTTLEK